jgi:hypothetical protein
MDYPSLLGLKSFRKIDDFAATLKNRLPRAYLRTVGQQKRVLLFDVQLYI